MTSDSGTFVLRKMRVLEGEPLRYALTVVAAPGHDAPAGEGCAPDIEMNPLVGRRLTLRHSETIFCQACGATTGKSYGQGHCFRCFKRLARCDLCVMAPHRCHYDQGTCREPEWGENFCMQPHYVYLANSSGLKVGITREGQQLTRWRDQGAVQGRLLARTPTRRAAGEIEAALAKTFSDRSQWRALVTGNAEPEDLHAHADRARELLEQHAQTGGAPVDVHWFDAAEAPVEALSYPIDQWPEAKRLNFKKTTVVSGTLLGIKGQYLLFDSGVFNVREHTGYEVELDIGPADSVQPDRSSVANSTRQIDLF